MLPPRAWPQAKFGATNVIVVMFMTTKPSQMCNLNATKIGRKQKEAHWVCANVRSTALQSRAGVSPATGERRLPTYPARRHARPPPVCSGALRPR